MSKRTPQEIYDYETKRSEEYLNKLNDLIDGHKNEDMIRHLFEWYGKARAIKSKAYQDMKVNNEVDWFNSFVDFVGNVDRNLYNEACEYADKTEE